MADKIDEQLSALMDGECAPQELDWVVRRLSRDDELQACWQRYHLIGDVIKNNCPEALDSEFSTRIRQAVASDIAFIPAAKAKPSPAWFKPAAGFALAASVAALAVFGLKPDVLNQTEPESKIVENSSKSATTKTMVATVDQEKISDDKVIRLQDYLVNHNGYASVSNVHGVLPYMRVVSYQNNR